MKLPYIICSNTGNIAGGRKLFVSDWQESHPEKAVFVGLAGDTNMAIGAKTGIWWVSFKATAQKVGRRGFVSLDGSEDQTVEKWCSTKTVAKTALIIQDIYGTLRNVFWYSKYLPIAHNEQEACDDAWFDIDVQMVERT